MKIKSTEGIPLTPNGLERYYLLSTTLNPMSLCVATG